MQESDYSYYESLPSQNYNIRKFEFAHVTRTDVIAGFNSIKSCAIGTDGIDPRFVRIILPHIIPYITHIFNSIILKSVYPSTWKYAKITPIPKADGSFRPIAILPFFSKVFEKIVNHQIVEFTKENYLLSKVQSGFRSNHSCTSALLKVSEDLRERLDKNMVSFLVLLDHSKAFDTVDHNILCLKLQKFFNFSDKSVSLIHSYLSLRYQSVVNKNEWSNYLYTSRGVPQGSILGPLLYSLYCNDLPNYVNHCDIHMYADDVQIYISSNTKLLRDCVRNLNDDLASIACWAKNNGLSLNPQKSQCVVISNRAVSISTDIEISLLGSKLNILKSVKNLGVIFNNRLKWDDHVNSAVGKTYGVLRNIYLSHKFTPYNIRLILAKTYLIPKLLYSCEIFAFCDASTKRKLCVAFNSIVRYVFCLRRTEHVSGYTQLILGVSLENYLKIRALLFLHKIIYSREPEYLYNLIQFSRSNRGRQIIQLRYYRCISNQHYFINTIRLWNNLPNNIQILNNIWQFKKKIFDFFSQM